MADKQKRLQKLSRMLRQIEKYDYILRNYYTPEEIMEAYERCNKKRYFYGNVDGLINVIWTGAWNEIEADRIAEEDKGD